MKHFRSRRVGLATTAGAALLGCLLTAGCTSAAAPEASPSAPAPSAPAPATSSAPPSSTSSSTPSPSASSASAPSSSPSALTIDITIADGKVTPNGEKLDAKVGETVVFNVTSDEDDEIHAHTGGDGYELEVPAGKPTRGSLTLTSAGSFEVESHHLEKVIVILNAR
ncbi:MAG TPA: hypothetical protein VIT20_09460 [Propionibacteriaceae bacterium]